MKLFSETINCILPLDTTATKEIQAHLDDLTKPKGSLGVLEELAMKYCLIRNTTTPVVPQKRVYTFAADHGVVEQNVSAFPKEVTVQMVGNIANNGAAINVLGRHSDAQVVVVDVGVDADLTSIKGLVHRKVRLGTKNMCKGPAMTTEEAVAAIEVGIEMAQLAANDGVGILATGEMGIGNTTAASALMHVLLPCALKDIVGSGTGIDATGMSRKQAAIEQAVKINTFDVSNPLSVLCCLGGLEIAAMAGLMLGAAAKRIPVIVDGFISSAAALVAVRLVPAISEYLIYSHLSKETGHRVFCEHVGARPLLDFKLRLGEGTGAALVFSLVDAAIKIYNEMATFSSAGVSTKKDD